MTSLAIQHHYRRYRRHQAETYDPDGNCFVTLSDGRQIATEHGTGGGAPYQEHALAAYTAARLAVHRENLRRKRNK